MDLNKITAAKNKNAPDYLTVKYITDGYDEFFRDPIFGNDEKIMRNFLSANPQNTNKNIVIQKIRLIDLLNSTHLQTHNKNGLKRIEEVLAEKIIDKEMNFDVRIKNGDPNLVDDIANAAKEVRLYSFASKYCHYHQAYALDKPKDDYPIYDTVLCETLPRYIKGVSKTGLANMFNPNYSSNVYEYKDYKDIVEKVLKLYLGNQYGNTAKFKGQPLRMLDRCLWYKNRHGG